MRTAFSITMASAALIGVLASPTALPIAAAQAESAVATIGQLEAQGFDVRIDRLGSAPLDQCQVVDVRNPQERIVRIDDDSNVLVPDIIKRTITVSLDCTR